MPPEVIREHSRRVDIRTRRINSLLDNQVRTLTQAAGDQRVRRRREAGNLLGIRGRVAHYGPPSGSLPCDDPESTRELAETKTRLKRIDGRLQQRLINWGYAICDVAMRTWADPNASLPRASPYPDTGSANIKSLQKAVAAALGKLGCGACCSGFDIAFRRELDFIAINDKVQAQGFGRFR